MSGGAETCQHDSAAERKRRRAAYEPSRRCHLRQGAYGLYTDGSCEAAQAAWGLVVTRRDVSGVEQRVAEHCGPVVTEALAPPWVGATRHSNNTEG